MNIFQIFQTIQNELFKDQTGQAYPADDFNLRLLTVNLDFLKQRYGLPEEYRMGKPMPKMAWQETQKITDDLRSILVHMGDDLPPLTVNSLGFANLPSDYLHQSTIYTDYGDIEVLPDDEFSSRLGAQIKKPTSKNAICRFLANQIQFAPKTLNTVKFTYLRMPVDAFMDYDLVNGGLVYLPEGSVHVTGNVQPIGTPSRTVQLDWDPQTHADIINMLVNYASKSLRSGFLYQETETRKQRGI